MSQMGWIVQEQIPDSSEGENHLNQKLFFILNAVLALGGAWLVAAVSRKAVLPLNGHETSLLLAGFACVVAGLDAFRARLTPTIKGLPWYVAVAFNVIAFLTGIGLVIGAAIQSQLDGQPVMNVLVLLMTGGAVFIWTGSSNIAMVCLDRFTRDHVYTGQY